MKLLITLVEVPSLICMVLTIAVYLYVNKLRNQLGKCLVFFLFCRFVTDIIILLNIWELLEEAKGICRAVGYTGYFFAMATNLWGTAFSHNVWKGIKSVNRNDPRSRFLAYNIFAWGTALILTAVIYLLDNSFAIDPYLPILPGVGFTGCWLNVKGRAFSLYFHFPQSVMDTYSGIVFILTAFHIAKVKRDLRKFIHNEESKMKLKSDKDNFLMLLRLFTIMALVWSLNIILRLTEGDIQMAVLMLAVYLNSSLGIIIFSLFILKRNTLRLLMESIRCMQNGQDVNNVQTA